MGRHPSVKITPIHSYLYLLSDKFILTSFILTASDYENFMDTD